MRNSGLRRTAVPIALMALALPAASGWTQAPPKGQEKSGAGASRRMADGKEWTVENRNAGAEPSYCYDDAELNCSRYGRLYTWESAQRACGSMGKGWRVPTDDDWKQLAKHHGGVSEDSSDKGKAAYAALMTGGGSGFNAVLGGGLALHRQPEGDKQEAFAVRCVRE